jgi:hypothetical protein
MGSVGRVGRRIAVGAAVLSVVAGGTALAVSAAGDEQVHACVSRGLLGIGKGTIRVVAAGGSCTSGEDALSWAVRGPVGPVGPSGPVGPVGPVGPLGPSGPVGPVGAVGPAGAVGPVGAVGATGATGAPGAAGVSGYEQVVATNDIVKGAFIQVLAVCPEGKVVLGGGYGMIDPASLQVWSNGPQGDRSWSVRFRNTSLQTLRVTVTANCVVAR